MNQAGVYGGMMHYLKAVSATKSKDPKVVMAWMKDNPTDDPLFGKGMIRADGRTIHDMYLFEVKKPSESKGPWDVNNKLATIPGDQAFKPMSQAVARSSARADTAVGTRRRVMPRCTRPGRRITPARTRVARRETGTR